MKKFTLLIIFLFAVELRIFSQENNNGLFSLFSGPSTQQNAVSIDFGTLVWNLNRGGVGVGASYERSIHKMFSVMSHISYSNHDWNYFAIEFHGR